MAKAIITSEVLRREFLNDKGDTVLFQAEFFYPQIENLNNEDSIDKVNQEIKKKAEDDFEAAFLEGSAYAKDSYDNAQPSSRLSLAIQQTFRIAYNQDNVISVVVQTYKNLGGAHPETIQSAYTYDLTTGNQRTASDILQLSEQSTKEYVAQSFYSIVYEQPEDFFPDALTILSNGNFEYGFYVEGDAIIFFLNPYVIAPYVAGVQTVHLLINPTHIP